MYLTFANAGAADAPAQSDASRRRNVGRRDRGHVGARICVFALVLGVCLAANAASALADTIDTPTIIGATPQTGEQTEFSFMGSADASGTWLEVLVRQSGPIACQPTYDDDVAAVPGSDSIYNRSYTVGPGPFSAPATFTPRYVGSGSSPESVVVCVWLMEPSGTAPSGAAPGITTPGPAPGITTAGPVSMTFTLAPPPPPPPSSQRFIGTGISTRPAAGVDSAGARFIFWRGRDHRLWESYYVGSGQRLVTVGPAGKIYSAPAVAVHGNGNQDVFWKGGDGRLWETWWNGTWHAAVDLKTPKLISDPTAGVDSAGHAWVFWRGKKQSLFGLRYNGRAWGHPFRVRGTGRVTSDPGVAVNPDGKGVDVFYRGGDKGLWAEAMTGRRWVKTKLGHSPLGSGPTAGTDQSGNVYVFWRGAHGGLWEATGQGAKWSSASLLDFAGTLGTPPSVAVEANGGQQVFWGGTDQDLWGVEYENGLWA